MKDHFIYRGCLVSIDENKIVIRKSDGSKIEKMCLQFIKDYDCAEKFITDYIDLNLHEELGIV
jgi:hypothetical protein